MQKRFGYLNYNHFQSYSNKILFNSNSFYLNKIENSYSLNNRKFFYSKCFIWFGLLYLLLNCANPLRMLQSY